jgi:allophanate hydrolase
VSFRLANALVGNSPGTPAFEMLLQGPTLRVTADSVRVALAGAGGSIDVRSNPPRRVPAGRSVRLVRGEVFRIGALGDSVCAYLAIEGGPAVPSVLGSASTYVRGGIGGFEGRRLAAGDCVPLRAPQADVRGERALSQSIQLALDQPIRVIIGPQDDYFTEHAIRTLLSSEYTISPQADRMGYRLHGPVLEHAKGYNIVSDGIVTGSIQVPGSGQPIVLMVDNQTTGGYPKIATVVSADIPVFACRKPGRTVRFEAVDLHEARRLRAAQQALVEQQLNAIELLP